jgi:hypothetical protein
MHEAGAYGSKQTFAVRNSVSEHEEDGSPRSGTADRVKANLAIRVPPIGENERIVRENAFDLGDRHPMLATFPDVALVPIETVEIHLSIRNVCTNVNTTQNGPELA